LLKIFRERAHKNINRTLNRHRWIAWNTHRRSRKLYWRNSAN